MIGKALDQVAAAMTEKAMGLPPGVAIKIYADENDEIQVETIYAEDFYQIDYDDLHNSVMAQYPTIIKRLAE